MTEMTHRRNASALTLLAACLALAAGGALPAPAAAQVERPEQIHYPPLPELHVPMPKRVELPNGMVVMLVEDHELPLVRATALVHTGGRLEPADKVGLADVTGTVLRTGGTEAMGPDELDDYLESKAAVIESSIDEDQGEVSLSCLVEDFPDVLQVFADVLRRPAFDPNRIQVALNAARSQVARQNDNPQSIVFRELRKVVWGPDSPYGRTPTYATLGNIGRDDLVAWHRRFYHPNRVVLGLVGDFDSDRVLALVRKAFGDWPRGPAVEPFESPRPEHPSPGVFVAEKSDVNQSNIAMGHPGILRSNPDFYAVEVMNEILGGGGTSRLFREVRTKKGLAYAVFGRAGSDWDHPGLTLLFTTTKVSTTGQAIAALLEEAKGMTSRPPTDDEVARAKQTILASFVFQVDSSAELLRRFLTFEYFGYPLDRLAEYRAKIEAVTAAEVRRAAATYLEPQNFSIVVVGPAEGRDSDLSAFGPVKALDISIPPPPQPTRGSGAPGSAPGR